MTETLKINIVQSYFINVKTTDQIDFEDVPFTDRVENDFGSF